MARVHHEGEACREADVPQSLERSWIVALNEWIVRCSELVQRCRRRDRFHRRARSLSN
jgi:hypothetical protein